MRANALCTHVCVTYTQFSGDNKRSEIQWKVRTRTFEDRPSFNLPFSATRDRLMDAYGLMLALPGGQDLPALLSRLGGRHWEGFLPRKAQAQRVCLGVMKTSSPCFLPNLPVVRGFAEMSVIAEVKSRDMAALSKRFAETQVTLSSASVKCFPTSTQLSSPTAVSTDRIPKQVSQNMP